MELYDNIIMYCPQTNKLIIFDNLYNLHPDIAIPLLKLGLKRNKTLEFIGYL